MAWTVISNALVAVGAKPFATTIQALRDNVGAGLAGDAGAPVNATGWHPYDLTTVGGAQTGLIYDFAVNGPVSTIDSPDFEDGYEYRFEFDQVGNSAPAGTDIRIQFFAQAAASLNGTSTLVTTNDSSSRVSGYVIVDLPRLSRRYVVGSGRFVLNPTDAQPVLSGNYGSGLTTADRVLRVRFDGPGGTFSAGKIFMHRRREFISG